MRSATFPGASMQNGRSDFHAGRFLFALLYKLEAGARFFLAPALTCHQACKPGSVPRERGDGHSSGTHLAMRLLQPTRAVSLETDLGDYSPAPPLFGLAPGGVCLAAFVAKDAVRSYRTLSPLPSYEGGLLSVALSLGSPPPEVIRHRASKEPGLSSPPDTQNSGRSGHPAC